MNNTANQTSFKKGHSFISGGEKGWFKKGNQMNVGKNHPQWKGRKATYSSVHSWVRRNKKYPKRCFDCRKVKKLEWSNINHKYARDLNEYVARCRACHMKYDRQL